MSGLQGLKGKIVRVCKRSTRCIQNPIAAACWLYEQARALHDCQSLSKTADIVALMVRTAVQDMHPVQAVSDRESDLWLVWCFEHCCKAEHRQVHKELMDVATDSGCKFVYHKKLGGILG